MLESNQLEFILEAHNGLSAKIVEETGFKGIWASGLSISASLGLRDNNEASWTQVCEVCEFMANATNIPILLDGDTGFGNFNNARMLVRKLEQIGVAGVCIEDKQFPKTNSFLNNNTDALADPLEFAGKIRAMKDSQDNPDFVVIARVEAFLVGLDTDEALRRAHIYAKAGADAILMHSKKSTSVEIDDFMARWKEMGMTTPVVIVPTKYYAVPTDHFREVGISLVIWANHNCRSAISAMRETSRNIFENQNLMGVEDKIVSVSEVFRIQGNKELEEAEKKYLPDSAVDTNAVVLAASRGSALAELTENKPKALLEVNGKTLLDHQVTSLNENGIFDISVITGYRADKVNTPNVNLIKNEDYASTTELGSLEVALDKVQSGTIISYGDLIYKKHLVSSLLDSNHEVTLVIDPTFVADGYCEYVNMEKGKLSAFNGDATINHITIDPTYSDGAFIGLMIVKSDRAVDVIKEGLAKLDLGTERMGDLVEFLLSQGVDVGAVYASEDSWVDLNTVGDFYKAGGLK